MSRYNTFLHANLSNQFHANTRIGNSSTRLKSDSIFSLNSTGPGLCYICYNGERVHQGQEALWAPVYNGMTRPPAQPWAGSTLTPQFHSRDTFHNHYKLIWCTFTLAAAANPFQKVMASLKDLLIKLSFYPYSGFGILTGVLCVMMCYYISSEAATF